MTVRIKRYPDWDLRLVNWLERACHTPFRWGKFDCALAAAEALSIQTGHDFSQGWKGLYSTATGARKRLLKRGLKDVYAAASDAPGLQPVAAEQLQRGDIAGAYLLQGRTLGVVWADAVWLPTPEGLRPYSLKLVRCGWRVDREELPCLPQ